MSKRYVPVAEQAKLIRRRLKIEFPGVKFSVRSKSYSGGASITVHWVDGPTSARVDEITEPYAGGGFDGMIDMAYSYSHWLMADGTVRIAHTSGTEMSRGTVPAYVDEPPTEAAELVRFMGDYVFTDREMSAETRERIRANTDPDEIRLERESRPYTSETDFAHRVFCTPERYPRTAWRAGLISAATAARAAGYDVEVAS
jgi:hypothetical protein